MPADEVFRDDSAAQSRTTRTGPRHAAPRKPLVRRLPSGKVIALAAMPSAVLMGMGFTPTLASADDGPSTSKSLTADEYQDCVEALDPSADASASPSPSASASDDKTEPSPSASTSSDSGSDSGKTSSSDSGSDDKAEPTPTPSASASKSSESSSSDTSTASPSASASSGGVLDDIGNALKDILTPGDDSSTSASPTPSASASASNDTSDTVKDTTDKVTDTVNDTVKDTTDTATKAAEDAAEKAKEAAAKAAGATESPSPSASASTDADNCPAATDDEGGVEKIVALPDKPWHLEASSLLLKGADYQGIVKVRTANGGVKEVLKYVISGGTDIGDLHQIVDDDQTGKKYHVAAGKGTTSTIRDGDTVMYTESISGNLFGLIPITFSPKSPPPLNIPLIYFTNVKVLQAGQFGGTLKVPGMQQYVTD